MGRGKEQRKNSSDGMGDCPPAKCQRPWQRVFQRWLHSLIKSTVSPVRRSSDWAGMGRLSVWAGHTPKMRKCGTPIEGCRENGGENAGKRGVYGRKKKRKKKRGLLLTSFARGKKDQKNETKLAAGFEPTTLGSAIPRATAAPCQL